VLLTAVLRGYYNLWQIAVGGCEYREPEDPGNLQFDWLEVQLEIFRQRGMQVLRAITSSPSPGNYFPECVSGPGNVVSEYDVLITSDEVRPLRGTVPSIPRYNSRARLVNCST